MRRSPVGRSPDSLGPCQPTKEVEMAVTSARRRAVTALIAVAGLALLTSLVATAQAQGQTRENLQAHGWTCVEFAPANRLISRLTP